jgi:WD40 repeat protein
MKQLKGTIPLLFFSVIGFSQSIETVIQKGHELAVIAAAVTLDSNYVVTGSRDKSAKLWEVSTGREVRSFLGHELSVTSLAMSADGKMLITGSNDKSVRGWDMVTGKELFKIETGNYITSIALDSRQRFMAVSGYNDSGRGDTTIVYDFTSRKILAKLSASPDKGQASGVDGAFSPDGLWLALGEDNRVATLYATSNWSKAHTFSVEEGYCGGCGTRVIFSPDSKFLYSVSDNGPIKKYSLASRELVKTYDEIIDDLTGLALSSDGKKLAIATETKITAWEESSGKLIAQLEAEEEARFHEIVFAPDGEQLVATCDNNTAFLWNISLTKKTKEFTGFLNKRDKGGLTYDPNSYWQSNIAKFIRFKNKLLITPDGKSLMRGRFGTKVKQWDIASGKVMMEYVSHKKAVLAYDLSKDGKRLLTGGGDGKIVLWDVATGDSLKVIQSYREPIFDIHFNSTEDKAVSSSWDATTKIHNLETGKLEQFIDFENNSAYNVLFHPNDLYVFAGRLDNSIQLLEIDTRKVVRDFIGHTNVISSLHVSPDQKTVMSSSWDGTIRLWDIGTGLMTKKFVGHVGAVHISIFSKDGGIAYTAGSDRIIRVWDVNSAKPIKKFEGHKAEITSLLVSPDGKMLISHSVDGVTKFWDLATGKEFFEHIHFGENDWMAKNPDGYFHGTDEARQYIHFVSGTKTFSVDQFFNDFFRPDLLPKIFQNRGGNESMKGVQGKLKSSPPPTVKVAVVPSTPGKADVFVRITNNGSGARTVRLFHNGKNINIAAESLKLPEGKGQTTTYKHSVELISGNNTLLAVASNDDNIESDPHSAEIFSDHISKNSICYLVAVGINQYKNPKLVLNYAKPDAQSFSELMNQYGNNLFKTIELHTLYDTEATRKGIIAKLEELSHKINPEDVFIFYYAGHGSMVDNQFYFIPTENSRLYDKSSLQKEAIEANILQEKFKHIKALKQLIIMDACQSGGSVELLATRGAGEEKAIAQLSRSAGIHVMASAGSDQFATEFAALGHGLFTHVLIQALQGEADGAPKDGKVTIYELKSYLDDQVPEMTRKLKGKPQYPYTFSRGQDFPLLLKEN